MAEQGSNKKKDNDDNWNILTPISLVLSLLMVCLTFASSILIGSHTKNNIVNNPSSVMIAGNAGEEASLIQIAGRITSSDGTPVANSRLQLHSVVQETYTDETGWFLFQDAQPVRHELFAVDSQGVKIASVILDLRLESQEHKFEIKDMEDGRVNIVLSSDIFYIEMDVTLNLQNDSLTIQPEQSYGAGQEGRIYTNDGILEADRGITILPSGTVINQQCQIIHYPVVIQNDGTVVQIPEEGLALSDGTQITKDEIRLPDGTAVKSGGEVIQADKTKEPPSGQTGDISGGRKNNKAAPPTSNTVNTSPADIPDSTDTGDDFNSKDITIIEPGNNTIPQGNGSSGGNSDNSGNSGGNSGNNSGNNGGNSGNNSGEPVDINVISENRDGTKKTWVEHEQIDLFYHQKDGNDTGDIPKIQPGSSGWYYFDVVNNGSRSIDITIRMTEDTIHLPLRFRLIRISGGSETMVTDWTSPMTWGHSVTLLDAKQMRPATTASYKVEWEWPFDTGIPAENENDTAVAGRDTVAERTYYLNMSVYAESR